MLVAKEHPQVASIQVDKLFMKNKSTLQEEKNLDSSKIERGRVEEKHLPV